MSDFIPKPGVKVGGLSRKAQKLQAMREKAANAANTTTAKSAAGAPDTFKTKAPLAGNRKTSFQRKAV